MRNPSIKTYSSCAVAGYLLELAAKEGEYIGKMQLIKLVYLCHGWYLGYYKVPLIHDPIEAWKYGPVISNLYSKLVKLPPYRSVPYDYFKTVHLDEKLDKGKKAVDMVHNIWDYYKKYTGIDLSAMTHKEGTPWEQFHRDGMEDLVISDAIILNYFKKFVNDKEDVKKSKEKI